MLLSLQLSGVPAVQMPLWHVSAPLHSVPSAHEVPFATTLLWHTPAVHTSVVQALPSLQSAAVPHGWQPRMGVCVQPLSGLHASVVQALPSSQSSGVPAVQVPLWQVSAPLHTVPSAHEVPLATGDVTQPRVGLHESFVQTFPSLQTSGVPAVQIPAWQVSAPLHTVPSAHDVPFATGVFRQPCTGSQLSFVHTLTSSQLRAVPAVHTPFTQVSFPLHTVASAQEVPFATAVFRQPRTGSQESVVQALLSLQLSAVPAVHVPAWHVSAPLHTVPSAHGLPFGTAEC